jgi:hypothetical protein
MKHLKAATLAASAFAIAASFSIGWSEQGGISLSVESAQARVGRPATPVSAAGVARRHARRGVYGVGYGAGAAAVGTAAAVAGAPYYYGAGTYPQGGPDYGPGTAANAYYMGYNNFMGYNNYEEYAKRNGIVCRRGTMVKLDDGKMYPCQ